MSINPLQPVSNDPYVKIFIWRGKTTKKENWLRFGHAALGIYNSIPDTKPSHYMSYWPGDPDCNCQKEGRSESHFHTYSDDLNAERRPPESTYDLYLQVEQIDKIKEAFVKFYNDGFLQWGTLGSSLFRKSKEQNCSGLVLKLLEKGDIRKIVKNDRTDSKTRMAWAVVTTVTVYSAVRFWTYWNLKNIERQWKYSFESFYDSMSVAIACQSASSYIEKICEHSSNILSQVKDKQLPELQEKIETIYMLASRSKESLEIINQHNAQAFPQLGKSVLSFGYKVMGSAFSLMLPETFSLYALYLNQKVILRTVTPADIERLARKVQIRMAGGVANKKVKKDYSKPLAWALLVILSLSLFIHLKLKQKNK